MNFSITRAVLLSATAIAGVVALPAFAQDMTQTAPQSETADAPGSEIVVTATRRAVSLQDVPINITAISGSDLTEKRIDDVRGLAAFTPGITILDTGPRSTGTIVMRGLSAGDTGTAGNNSDNAVAIYLGEVPLYQDFKLLDIGRVETLLGPQGTLYGVGTLAGAIRYIPNRPNATKWEASFHGRVYDVAEADNPGFQVDATFNIPIVEDKIALRSTVGYYNDPGFIDYVALLRQPGVSLPQPGGRATSRQAPLGTPAQIAANLYTYKDANFERTFTTRNTLGFFPSENVTVYLNYAYQKTSTNGRQINGAGVFGTGRYEAAQRYLEPSNREVHLVSGEVQIDVGEIAQIVSATAWSHQKLRSSADVTDLLLDLDYGYELYPEFSGFTRSATDIKQFNQEVRLVSTHGGPLSWVIGGFYNERKSDGTYREVTPGLPEFYFGPVTYSPAYPEPIEYASFNDSKVIEKAVFGEATFEITPQWQVTAGGRYFDYDAKTNGGITLPLLEPVPVLRFDTGGGDSGQDGVVWKFNTSYKITPDLMLYATYSEGYRIGGPNSVPACPANLADVQNACALPNEQFFGPDSTENKEIGIRATLFGGKLQTTIAGYHIKWDGIQLASQTQYGIAGITANGGSATSKGIEATFMARPADGVTITGSYSYNDAKLTQDVIGLLTIRNQNLRARPKNIRVDVLSGDRLPGTARHTASLGMTYDVPVGADAIVSTNFTTTYQGEVLSRVGARAGGEVIPDYMISRASIGYRRDKYEVRIYADNLFNQYAISSVGEDRSRRIINDGIVSRYYSNSVIGPRKIGIEYFLKF
ncbi:MAG: TonB-dependent receptor [Novosphingobium sp.]|nr:TonB-dependent receptor [Novosphingobium sp.]